MDARTATIVKRFPLGTCKNQYRNRDQIVPGTFELLVMQP